MDSQISDPPQDLCFFCKTSIKQYTCPRCNIGYCSTKCFRSQDHLQCSETFYQACVLENMQSTSTDDDGAQQKMMEIFKRILKSEEPNQNSDDELDSDDDVDSANLAKRLENVNLDDTAEVWKNLTPDEQQEFEAFLRSGDVSKFIPVWKPWWTYQYKKIQEVNTDIESYKSSSPKHKEDIKEFSSLTKATPATCVKYNLSNILAAYAFTVRYFNGDHLDFPIESASYIMTLSLCLKENKNFESLEQSITSVEEECLNSDWVTCDEENISNMKADVKLIMKGPHPNDGKFYIMSALSDFYGLIEEVLKGNKNDTNLL